MSLEAATATAADEGAEPTDVTASNTHVVEAAPRSPEERGPQTQGSLEGVVVLELTRLAHHPSVREALETCPELAPARQRLREAHFKLEPEGPKGPKIFVPYPVESAREELRRQNVVLKSYHVLIHEDDVQHLENVLRELPKRMRPTVRVVTAAHRDDGVGPGLGVEPTATDLPGGVVAQASVASSSFDTGAHSNDREADSEDSDDGEWPELREVYAFPSTASDRLGGLAWQAPASSSSFVPGADLDDVREADSQDSQDADDSDDGEWPELREVYAFPSTASDRLCGLAWQAPASSSSFVPGADLDDVRKADSQDSQDSDDSDDGEWPELHEVYAFPSTASDRLGGRAWQAPASSSSFVPGADLDDVREADSQDSHDSDDSDDGEWPELREVYAFPSTASDRLGGLAWQAPASSSSG